MKRGELYWVEFLPSNGHGQSGRRPAVVLQDESIGVSFGTVVVVPVTGSPANIRFPGAVLVNPSAGNGITKHSIILTHQIRSIDRRRFGKRISVIEPAVLTAVHEALDRLIGRPAPAAPATPPADPT